MPKTKIIYICSYCGSEFSNEDEARRCEEKNHVMAQHIVEQHFKRTIHVYPDTLLVEMANGAVVLYRFELILSR